MPLIRFVYFDLDDTLLDHRNAERKALSDVCGMFPGSLGRFPLAEVQETYHTHNVALWQLYGEGAIGRDELMRLRFERLLEALRLDTSAPMEVSDCYLQQYARHWTFLDGARDAFFRISDHFPVGVLTNGFSEVQHAKLDSFPEIRERLAALVVSEDVGFLKPHPAIFQHATDAAGVEAASILYVGDSYRSDVSGARGAGWYAAWYTSETAEERQEDRLFRFSKWPELLEWLDLGADNGRPGDES